MEKSASGSHARCGSRALDGPGGPIFVLGWMQPEQVEHVLAIAPTGTGFIFQQSVRDYDEGRRKLEAMYACT